MTRQYKSEALAAAHEAALGLAEAGVMSKRTMKVFDEMCLMPVADLAEDVVFAVGEPFLEDLVAAIPGNPSTE